MKLAAAVLAVTVGCAKHAPRVTTVSPPPAAPAAPAPTIPLQPSELPTEPGLLGSRRGPGGGPLTQAERDSLLQEMSIRRDAWRARKISDYRLLVASGCFCPGGGTPAILVVKGGVPVALEDTTGNPMGSPREPWSLYTVEGLFAAVEASVRRDDVVEVVYSARYDYPALIRGDASVRQVDDWFWIKADRLTPVRP